MKSLLEKGVLVVRLKLFMLARLLLISIFLGASPFVLGMARTPFFVIIGFLYIATVIYSFLLKSGLSPKFQAYGQFFIDIVIETALLSFTGGIDSGYVLFYVLSIISASIIIGGRAGVIMSISCSSLYALLGVLGCLGIFPESMEQAVSLPGDPLYVGYFVFVRGTILCLLGFLGDHLANSLYRNRLELDRYKKLNEEVLMQMRSGLITTDHTGKVIYVNSAAEKILGYGRDRMIGKSWHQFLGPPVNDLNVNWLTEKAKSFTRCEIKVRSKEGKLIPIGFTVSSLVDETGTLMGLLILFRDLTQIQRMEERMRKADRLSAAGTILASVAHEVRNPLASIRGAVEVLREDRSFSEDNENLMGVIIRESDRLNRIVSDFLQYTDGRKPEYKREEIAGLLGEALALVEEGGRSDPGVRFATAAWQEPIFARVDASQMKQVFINVLDNALEAIPYGGTITVGLEKRRSSISGKPVARITISDNGEGMNAERMSHLFEPFYSTKDGGTGMGLFIAERIVRNHGGQFEAESREGGGSDFTVTIPCEEGA